MTEGVLAAHNFSCRSKQWLTTTAPPFEELR